MALFHYHYLRNNRFLWNVPLWQQCFPPTVATQCRDHCLLLYATAAPSGCENTLHCTWKKHNGRKHWGCLERKSGFFLLFEQLSILCLQFTSWPSTLHQNYFRCKTQTAPVCWCERFDKYHDCPCGERMLLHLCQSHFVSIKSSSASNKIDNITKGNFTNRKKFCLDVKAWMPGRKLNFLIGLHFCESIMLEMPFLCAVMMHRDHRICCQPLKYIVSIWLNNHRPHCIGFTITSMVPSHTKFSLSVIAGVPMNSTLKGRI